MDAFVYRDGDVVPWDAIRVAVHPSVRILPPEAFLGCEKLEVVELNEGLEEIGHKAFWGCRSLRRLACPPALRRIGYCAFMGCRRLSAAELNEGLEEIGHKAFGGCVSLSRLECPSTLVRIGEKALVNCWKLSAVELAGILRVEMDAFSGCRSLGRIGFPSRAFVVRGEHYDRSYTCRLVTDGTVASTINRAFVLIAPGCLTTLPESNLTELGSSIGEIMNNVEGTIENRLDRVRREVFKEVWGEVSAILGLAFWKAKIDEAELALMESANNHCENTGGGRKRAKVGIALTREAREGCRGEGKGTVIAQNVFPFLDGLLGNGSQGDP